MELPRADQFEYSLHPTSAKQKNGSKYYRSLHTCSEVIYRFVIVSSYSYRITQSIILQYCWKHRIKEESRYLILKVNLGHALCSSGWFERFSGKILLSGFCGMEL